jgi:multidrug efflux pump subunit AcrA (membrane-fusion protein)
MLENTRNIEVRSDEVQEIMSHVPNWMIRWGITLIFVLIIGLMGVSWFIKYPDVIVGQASLTTEIPPNKLVVKNHGEIDFLSKNDNSIIKQGDVIATIRSTISEDSYHFLKSEISEIKDLIEQNQLLSYSFEDNNQVFGQAQEIYSSLILAIQDYQLFHEKNELTFNLKNTKQQIENQKALLNLTNKQLKNTELILANAQQKYKSDKILFEKDIIAQSEFFEREKAYNNTVTNRNDIEKLKIQTIMAITSLERELNNYQIEFEKKQIKIDQRIQTGIDGLTNLLKTWKQNYQLISPIDGQLVYLQEIAQHQFIQQGTELFAIVPSNKSFIAQINLPKVGYGKIKVGQKVMVKVDNYPYQEYGQLEGEVEKVSIMANNENYLVSVRLTKGLKTSYNENIKYSPEMSGTAEIITEDLRVIERVFNKFKRIFE